MREDGTLVCQLSESYDAANSLVFAGAARTSGCATGVSQKREWKLTTHGHQKSGRVSAL